jgi:hypothetical protein
MHRALAVILFTCPAAAATYYVDCAAGADNRAGASPESAWRTPAKVSATTFAPGDSILFRRGVRCEGSLWPKGSGENGRVIRIDAYGEGPLPILSAPQAEAAVKLFDQQYWEIENLEISGGNPYGVFIGAGGTATSLKHFVLRNLVVHDVSGNVRQKSSGLVVIAASGDVALEDITVDGVTAFRTSQWAGIFISGGRTRARNVAVRNCIVHDVAGDGIVIFLAENGRIEKSAAWHTGLQETETIGTPNAIWTWSCRNCIVENNEGFWIDSPGVDGGVYDIDWGNDDNIVQHNYGHDAQGYCAAVFGAGNHATTNSAVRYNICVNNGRSPKLARRQGDIFTSTWDGGSLDGLTIDHNTIMWNPPIDAPAVQMRDTAFTGGRPATVSDNLIYSSVPSLVEAGKPVIFERNLYWHAGEETPRWLYETREYRAFEQWKQVAPGDLFGNPLLDWLLTPAKVAVGAIAFHVPASAGGSVPAVLPRTPGKWMLLLFVGRGEVDARSQLVFLQSALAQYEDAGLEAAAVAQAGPNLSYDWNFGAVRAIVPAELARAMAVDRVPSLLLISPAGQVVRRWTGFASPAALGLTLKHYLGAAHGDPLVEIESSKPARGDR